MKRRRRWPRRAAYVLLFVVLLAFPYGPLFPWSPWKPGFEHVAMERSDVYYPAGTRLPEAYRECDALLASTEQFLNLKATKRLTVVLTNKWNQFRRLQPQLPGRGIGASTLATGTIVYVAPTLDEKALDHREFLLHEFSHAVMNQNQSLSSAVAISRVYWLAEGLCVANGRQRAYLSREEFLGRARREGVQRLFEPVPPSDLRFAYPAWRYFNEYLMETKGSDRYHRYLVACLKEPGDWRQLFVATFGVEFSQAVAEFEGTLR